MKYAIRDDDTSFFTKPDELLSAYRGLEGRCISLSVVPFAFPVHAGNKPYGDYPERYYPLHENTELIDFLKTNIAAGNYDILLHGYSHEYVWQDGQWIPEMLWKSSSQLQKELKEGKRYLEENLDTVITVFAAPSNAINKIGISVLEELKMNFSGIIKKRESREVNIRLLINLIYRYSVRSLFRILSPGLMNYGKHYELVAYPLNNYEEFEREYKFCKRFDKPFVIYTHYWELNRNPKSKALLERIVSALEQDGADCVPLSQLYVKTEEIKNR